MTYLRMDCRRSIPKTIALLVFCTTCGAACYYITWIPVPIVKWVGWILVAFCALSALTWAYHLIKGDPVVIVDENGIENRRGYIKSFDWEDVISVQVVNQDWLIVGVRDEDKYLARVRPFYHDFLKWRKRRLGGLLRVSFAGLDPNAEQIAKYIETCRPEITVNRDDDEESD